MSTTSLYLGVRCSNISFAFALLSGTKEAPRLEHKRLVPFPKNFTRSHSLKWLYQEVDDILKKHQIGSITIKGTEPSAQKGGTFIERTENEAIIYLIAANHNLSNDIARKVKATIAKDLLAKGKPSLLETQLDTSHFPGFQQEDEKIRDAILAAWSSM